MLSAEEARQLVVKSRKKVANSRIVRRHMSYIEKRIKTAALDGHRDIKGPFFKTLSPTILAAIIEKIESHGYTWIPGGYEHLFHPHLRFIKDESLKSWICDLMKNRIAHKPRKDEIRW